MNGIRDHKKMLCIFLSLVCCLTLFVIPSFADSSNQYLTFMSSTDKSYAETDFHLINSELNYTLYVRTNSSIEFYFFMVDSKIYIASYTNFSSPVWRVYNGYSTSNLVSSLSTGPSSFDASSGLYYLGTSTLNYSCDYTFDTLNDALSAIANGGGSDSPSSSGVDKNVYVEAGYVAYIQVADGDMDLSAVMNSYSGISMGGNPWGNNATIGYGYSNLPTSGTTFPVTGSYTIPWEKSSYGRNWLGQTKYAVYSRSVTSSDNWIVIYNPAQFSLAAKGSGELNPTIKAHFTNLLGYRKYALTQDYNVTDNTFDSYSVSDFEDYYIGTVDEEGNLTESASNENMNATPSPGGTGNLADGSGTVSISDYLQQIRETLDNFANNFIGLLQSPISHVRQLISAGFEYFSVIRGLYAWLPDNVQSTLESAMIVSLSIGVIGLLL